MTSIRLPGAALAVALLAPAAMAAQGREPVLKQVRVPHGYYWREMYLPQATSGPSAATWSPDGAELIYSMQGSLWRQRVGSSEARQLTDGPGYDYQPDWSPDGRAVVYASYRDDAVQLRMLDLASGRDAPLVADGAVNVEPRWSPDGSRIAWVSTAHEGRWHVHTATVRYGRVVATERITEDRDDKLPRYYYGAFDHFLSPTWSPDGRELILVSNRGRIWGSGGFWRMEAKPGAPMRPLHHEETTWKARPDWARDGRRVVYSSYLGRQWNQLWLMTSQGGDPMQLTYGEFDATAPRWSPDGRRIAFISNEKGNTALEVFEIPGGRRVPIEATTRHYLRPVGRLRIAALDATSGRAVAARISVTTADGRSWTPDDAWRHADDAFDRAERRIEYGYFHADGEATLVVPAGTVTVEVTRGLAHRAERRTVVVAADSTSSVRVPLRRLADLPGAGWYSGDLHVHMNYGGAYRADPATLARQARAEDLHVVENLIVNKEGRIPDIAWFRGAPDPVSDGSTLVVHDQEFHTSFWGHTALLGLRDHLLLPGYAAYANTAVASLYPTNATAFDLARAQGAVGGYVHPFDVPPDPAADEALTNALPVDVALGAVDYLEVVGFSEHLTTARVWYRLLNCGFRIPAGAGTDAMTNFASLRGPVGMNRVFVQVDGPLDHERFLAGLKAGRTVATNGPLLDFALDGRGIGGELRLPAGGGTVRARVTLRSIVPVEHLEIVGNGEVVAEIPLAKDRTSATATVTIPVTRSGWYTLRARGTRATHPVLDLYPFATTSPIYVVVGDAPVRSRADAEYFLAWIGRLEGAVREHRDWNGDAERAEVVRQLAAARAEFVARSAP
ncbi:MAG TPA: CehA/McbA family metallohydrolase [Gemmatimonadaceae bacterium]